MSKFELLAKIELLNKYEAMIEEMKAEADAVRDAIKAEMTERDTEELIAGQYIIRWTSVLSNRFDQFGKDTVLVPVDDDHFCAILPVELSPPFCAWVATFGRAAKILSPDAAITEMRKFIERVSDMYKDDGEK